MLYPRIIPCLLVHNKGLVKTTNFKDPKYVGDPINAVKIFNEKEADELTVLDIDATVENRLPDFKLIKHLANESRMPLCYGGGIKTVDVGLRILGLGIEKISLSSIVVENPKIVNDISSRVGNQSVVVTLDIKKKKFSTKFEILTHNGKKKTGINPEEFVKKLEDLGAGEIVINSIDRDGTMNGYDLELIERIRENVSVPLTALGGAGFYDNLGELIKKFGIIGAGAGSLFVFKGKYRAVLINYPDFKEKKRLIDSYYLQ